MSYLLNYFFPESSGLKSVSAVGPIPRKGELVRVEDYRIKDHNYSQYGLWTVKEVYYHVVAVTGLEDVVAHLDKPVPVIVSVHLHKGRKI